EAPGVVAGVAAAKVMAPVWLGSPKVTAPAAVVKTWASSALLRFRPLPEGAPTWMGRSGRAERITTPPAAGVGGGTANKLTVVPAPLATKRLPLASMARAPGPLSPVRVAVGVVLPGASTLTVLAPPVAP